VSHNMRLSNSFIEVGNLIPALVRIHHDRV
jgi:hypothetical protein